VDTPIYMRIEVSFAAEERLFFSAASKVVPCFEVPGRDSRKPRIP
jgi:hypothetical protein